MILSGEEEITAETLERDWSLVEPVVIPAIQLRNIDVETRIVPVEQEDGAICYEVSVWLRWDDEELEGLVCIQGNQQILKIICNVRF